MTPIKDAFVKALFSTLPKELARDTRVHFCSPSGSDAVEAAIKLVKTATGRRGIIGCSGGYHGHTQGALAVMGNRASKKSSRRIDGRRAFRTFPLRRSLHEHSRAPRAACAYSATIRTCLSDVLCQAPLARLGRSSRSQA
jgi:4-aminobutyrate aminotransferase-like enzyme